MSDDHDPAARSAESEQADAERETITFIIGDGPDTMTVYRDDWEASPSPEAQEFLRSALANHRRMQEEGRIIGPGDPPPAYMVEAAEKRAAEAGESS